jgi:glycosyltransferase involved in cell wall biosynthesis
VPNTDVRPTLSAVIIARDEAGMIERCLDRVAFADERLVVIDDRTVDDTAARARARGASVVEMPFTTFSDLRNRAIGAATGDWLLFVDADERVTTDLAAEIRSAMLGPHDAHRLRIQNWFYGSRIRDSGFRERPIRLVRREGARFVGDIHETLELPAHADVSILNEPLIHLSHRSVLDNLDKTAAYADIQAREMLAAGHPRITRWSLARTAVSVLVRHLVVGRGYRDGTPGFVESMYQSFSIFCVHVRLWELQRQPSIEARYEALEEGLA